MFLPAYAAKSGEEGKEKTAESIVSIWESPKDGKTLSLVAFEQAAPIMTTLDADTRAEGICIHCQIELKCCIGDIAKRCAVCPCGLTNSVCLTGKNTAEKSWTAFLQILPRGTQLRVEYVNPARPEEGLKRLKIDRRGVLLPIEGMNNATPDQIQALGKSVGATRTEVNSAKTRLQLNLKDNWTAEKEARLEKGMAKLGAKVISPPGETTAS